MIIELQIIDETLSNKEIKTLIQEDINKIDISKVCVLPCHLPIFHKYLDKKIELSTIIDFPFGILSTDSRKILAENAINNGAKTLELLCPSYMIVNKLYSQLKEDISTIYDLCSEYKIGLSYIIDYRTYTYDSLHRICKLLLANKINSIYISTGYKIDDIYDHLIAMAMIQKKLPELNIVPNCNIFNKNHHNIIITTEIPRIRVSSIQAANLFLK